MSQYIGENYQGGIVGAQANSYAVNCGANGSIAVKASGSYAGGVSGISTVGWITNLGNKEVKDVSLLTTVKDLLTGLLSSDPEKAGMLVTCRCHHQQSWDVTWIVHQFRLRLVRVIPVVFWVAVMASM